MVDMAKRLTQKGRQEIKLFREFFGLEKQLPTRELISFKKAEKMLPRPTQEGIGKLLKARLEKEAYKKELLENLERKGREELYKLQEFVETAKKKGVLEEERIPEKIINAKLVQLRREIKKMEEKGTLEEVEEKFRILDKIFEISTNYPREIFSKETMEKIENLQKKGREIWESFGGPWLQNALERYPEAAERIQKNAALIICSKLQVPPEELRNVLDKAKKELEYYYKEKGKRVEGYR